MSVRRALVANPAVNSDAPVHLFCFAYAVGGAPVT